LLIRYLFKSPENMFINHYQTPVLQRSKSKVITVCPDQKENINIVGTFHNFNIIHPITNENKTIFMYLFLSQQKSQEFFSFKPVMDTAGNTVSIIYELGTGTDNELATMALLYLLTNTLSKCYLPAFDIPNFGEIIEHFKGTTLYVKGLNEKEWWQQ